MCTCSVCVQYIHGRNALIKHLSFFFRQLYTIFGCVGLVYNVYSLGLCGDDDAGTGCERG